jgi:ribosomal protein L37AE/L43A
MEDRLTARYIASLRHKARESEVRLKESKHEEKCNGCKQQVSEDAREDDFILTCTGCKHAALSVSQIIHNKFRHLNTSSV